MQLDIVYLKLEGKPHDLPLKEARKALIRSGVYPGNKCWIDVTADLNWEGLCKRYSKDLLVPTFKWYDRGIAYKRALETYETITKKM